MGGNEGRLPVSWSCGSGGEVSDEFSDSVNLITFSEFELSRSSGFSASKTPNQTPVIAVNVEKEGGRSEQLHLQIENDVFR